MFEIIILIIVIVCILYIFKGEFFRKKAVVTVVKNLPLDIFKKKDKNKIKNYVENNNNEDIKVNEEYEVTKEDNFSKDIEVTESDDKENNIEDNSLNDLKNSDEFNDNDNLMNNDIIESINEEYIEVDEDDINNVEESIKENRNKYIEELENDTDVFSEEIAVTVYWTPKGKSYHMSSTCRTLSRSKVINSGTLEECHKECACEHCR